jgi:hypothetical protein
VSVLPELALPVLPVWLTAHRELRASVVGFELNLQARSAGRTDLSARR